VTAVPFAQVAGLVQRRIMRPPGANPHMVFLAKTRAGKDHLIRWGLLPYFPLARTVVLITKPGADDETWAGFGNVIGARELPPGFGRGPDGTPRYVVRLPPGSRADAQYLLDQLAAEGECIIVIGDTARLVELPERGGLACEGRLSNMMRDGAASGLAMWACANSAKWAASGIRDQAAAVLIGHAAPEAYDDFARIAGIEPKSEARRALDQLRPHWWLWTDHLDGELRWGATTPPDAGWCDEAWPAA
jgi:hypothetical protein